MSVLTEGRRLSATGDRGRGTRILRRGAVALAGAGIIVWSSVASAATGGYADLVEKVAPSVVTVFTTQPQPAGEAGASPFGPGSPFEDFARRFGIPVPQQGPQQRPGPAHGLGSGFVIDPTGYVVTNNHVVEGATEVKIKLGDQQEYAATVVGTDRETDLALLKVDAGKDLPAAVFGNSESLRVGDPVIAVGNPFGLGGTVTSGIVSARGRAIDDGPYVDFIQTDAAINRGNSGGPLFNMDGQVVGVNSAILSPNGGSVGVGFAIPSDTVRTVIAQLRESGRVERGWLGVSVQPVTPEIADAIGLADNRGALVAQVMPDGPAEGRLQSGDVIRSVDGKPVESMRELPKLIAASRIGEPARIGIVRDGKSMDVAVDIGRREQKTASAADHLRPERTAALGRLGVTVAPVTDEVRSSLGLEDSVEGAVVTSLKPDGAAAKAGLVAGDVIEKIDGRAVKAPSDLEAAVRDAPAPSVLVLINRHGSTLFVGIRLADA
ncbi:DegQ family serine endoprotease [Thalassobaculum sp.]|uniref:DegQ family serine endoprotease n=1 Tax=Thalassobaculum sp. TaxID=2022740 RepID=UPI0032EDA534